LAKEPNGRFVSTEDLAREIATIRDHLAEATTGATAAGGEAARTSNRRRVASSAIAITLVAARVLGPRWWSSRDVKTFLPTFKQLTFRRGNLLSARFTQDGKTVAYSAAWDGAPAEIFTVRTDSVGSSSVGLNRADLLSVSSKGELAILINKGFALGPIGTG